MSESLENLVDQLDENSILAELPEACLEALVKSGQKRSYSKGQTIFQKGDEGDFLAIILSGQLKISGFSVSGDETVLNLLQVGDVVGEIAVIDGSVRTADAIAVSACELLIFPRAAFVRLMTENGEFGMALARALCVKLRAASDALESTTLDMGRRVASALVRLAEQNKSLPDDPDIDFELAIDQTTLARYAGLTRSNLNRVLKRFERANASRHEKGVLKIFDMEWIEEFAMSDDE